MVADPDHADPDHACMVADIGFERQPTFRKKPRARGEPCASWKWSPQCLSWCLRRGPFLNQGQPRGKAARGNIRPIPKKKMPKLLTSALGASTLRGSWRLHKQGSIPRLLPPSDRRVPEMPVGLPRASGGGPPPARQKRLRRKPLQAPQPRSLRLWLVHRNRILEPPQRRTGFVKSCFPAESQRSCALWNARCTSPSSRRRNGRSSGAGRRPT